MCGLCPKLAALVSIMPQSVLGGAAVMMFSSIVISGIQLITKNPLTARNLSIVSVALGVGYGMGANTGILANAPQFIQLIFGGSGIVPAAMVAIYAAKMSLNETQVIALPGSPLHCPVPSVLTPAI